MAIKIGGTTVIDDSRNITNIVDLPVIHGGTGASTEAAARTNLGLEIGTDVQAWDADLDTWATKTAPTGTVIGTSDTQTLTNKTLASPTVTGNMSVVELTETVYNLTGTDIDPANGTMQYKVLSGTTNFTYSLTSGQSVLLRIGNGSSYTVGWGSVTWVNGSAPTLTTNDLIVFFYSESTQYANYLGDI